MGLEKDMKIRYLGHVDYLPTFEAMKAFTAGRNTEISRRIGFLPCDYGHDQLWICEHPAVYTQGLAGKPGHILNPGDIPVVQTDRGGQVLKTSRESAALKPCKIDFRLRRRNAHST